MKIISANINGLNSAVRYGFFDWLVWQNPDIACLQELNVAALPSPFSAWAINAGFEIAAQLPTTSGNGGVAVLSRYGFENVTPAAGILRAGGQVVTAQCGGVEICCSYVSLRNSAEERAAFQSTFESMRAYGGRALICGDFNIIANREDGPSSFGASKLGCHPEERAWLNALRNEWVDVLPRVCPDRPLFTWWARNRERFENNLGTRIDYQLATPAMAAFAVPKSGRIFRDYYHGVRITDHGPITIEYDV